MKEWRLRVISIYTILWFVKSARWLSSRVQDITRHDLEDCLDQEQSPEFYLTWPRGLSGSGAESRILPDMTRRTVWSRSRVQNITWHDQDESPEHYLTWPGGQSAVKAESRILPDMTRRAVWSKSRAQNITLHDQKNGRYPEQSPEYYLTWPGGQSGVRKESRILPDITRRTVWSKKIVQNITLYDQEDSLEKEQSLEYYLIWPGGQSGVGAESRILPDMTRRTVWSKRRVQNITWHDQEDSLDQVRNPEQLGPHLSIVAVYS